MYLKIFLIWGTEKVWELQDQKDLFSHLRYRYLPTCSKLRDLLATLPEFCQSPIWFCKTGWQYLSQLKTKFEATHPTELFFDCINLDKRIPASNSCDIATKRFILKTEMNIKQALLFFRRFFIDHRDTDPDEILLVDQLLLMT